MKPDLEAIRGRVEKATAGPWRSQCEYGDPRNWDDTSHFTVEPLNLSDDDGRGLLNAADSDFIASARADIPALLAYVDSLERVAEAGKEWAATGPNIDDMETENLYAALAALSAAGMEK